MDFEAKMTKLCEKGEEKMIYYFITATFYNGVTKFAAGFWVFCPAEGTASNGYVANRRRRSGDAKYVPG